MLLKILYYCHNSPSFRTSARSGFPTVEFNWNSNDGTNFPQKLLLTDTQVSKIRKAFASGSSGNLNSTI